MNEFEIRIAYLAFTVNSLTVNFASFVVFVPISISISCSSFLFSLLNERVGNGGNKIR